MGFSRQEYWSGLSFPSPGDLPNPGIQPTSPSLQADSLPTELWLLFFFFSLVMLGEKAMALHSSTLAWKIPWTEEPGRLQSMGSLRVGHDWATSLSRIREGNGNPLQCSCLENPRDRGAWWAAVYGVAESHTTEVT